MKIEKKCATCGKIFLIRKCDKDKRKFCSRLCCSESLKGKKASAETKRKMSKSHSGKNNAFYGRHHTKKTKKYLSEINVGKPGYWTGKKRPPPSEEARKNMSLASKGKPKSWLKDRECSAETREKISKANIGKIVTKETREKLRQTHLGNKASDATKEKLRISHLGQPGYWTGKKRLHMTGEKHPNYIDGRTPEIRRIRSGADIRSWRKAVFIRDNWTCQKYKIRGRIELRCHHIKNFSDFPELRFDIDNGVTLSKKAHEEFHKKYGYRNNTREQLVEFLA